MATNLKNEAQSDDISEGPEGRRWIYLTNALNATLAKISSKVTIQLFKEQYGNFIKNPKSLEKCCSTVKNHIEQEVPKKIINHFRELGTDKTLHALEQTVEDDQDEDETAWRPTHDVQSTLRSHDVQKMMREKTELEEILKAKREKLRENEKHVQEARAQMEKNDERIRSMILKYQRVCKENNLLMKQHASSIIQELTNKDIL